MCQAVSFLATKSKKIYWKAGVDSHEDLIRIFKKDPELMDDKEPPDNTFARVEISPENKDYLRPDKWVFKLDERIKPNWWDDSYEKLCWKVLPQWKKQIYSQINLKEAKNPIHPFKIKAPKKITKKHLALLRKWASVGDSVWDSGWDSVRVSVRASVWDSVRASVWDSVRASVRASVGDSVWASVWDSVRASGWGSVRASGWGSVRASVGAYYGTLFPKIKKWKYCERVKEKGYPFKSGVKLWKMGLVSSYDGKEWRLHGSPKGNGKSEILWEGEITKIK